MLNSVVPNLYRMRTPATSATFTSTSTTSDRAIHKRIHETRSYIAFMVHKRAVRGR